MANTKALCAAAQPLSCRSVCRQTCCRARRKPDRRSFSRPTAGGFILLPETPSASASGARRSCSAFPRRSPAKNRSSPIRARKTEPDRRFLFDSPGDRARRSEHGGYRSGLPRSCLGHFRLSIYSIQCRPRSASSLQSRLPIGEIPGYTSFGITNNELNRKNDLQQTVL